MVLGGNNSIKEGFKIKARKIKKIYKRLFGGSWEIFLSIDNAFENKKPPSRWTYRKQAIYYNSMKGGY